MSSFTREALKKQASRGLLALVLRKFFFQFIQTSSTIVLARLLFPKAFGDFAIMVFLVEFLAILPNQGFSAAIIQKKTKLQKGELSSIFWLVTAAALLIIALLWLFAPLLDRFYKGAIEDGIFLIRLCSFAVLAINIRAVPSAILERQLKYKRLATIEIMEAVITQIISISLALTGLGVKSLAIGYLCGKIFASAAFMISSNFLRLTISLKSLWKFSPFAVNTQIYYLTYSISGAVTPVYVGAVLGTSDVGYLTLAGSVGLIPWSIAELVGRVSLPVFSKAQKDREIFQKVAKRSFDFLSMVTLPACVVIFAFAPQIIGTVYSPKWLPAVSALRLFVVLGAIQSAFFIFTMALFGQGQIKFIRNVTLLSAILFWILAVVMVPKIGFTGIPLAWIMGASVQALSVLKVKKTLSINFLGKIFVYLGFSLLSVMPVYFFLPVNNFVQLLLAIFSTLVIYICVVFLFQRNNLKFLWKQGITALR